jgi:hypothetical protein
MSKFTDEEREAILAEMQATLDRLDGEAAENKAPEPSTPTLEEILAQPPCESRASRDRRELAEREARLRRRRRQRETTIHAAMAQLETRLEQNFGALVADQREFALQAIEEAFACYAELIVEDICAPFERKIAALQASLEVLERKLRSDSGQVIDLPALPMRSVQ